MIIASVRTEHVKSGNIHIKSHSVEISHCVKIVQIRSFSGPYFPGFGLKTEIYGVQNFETFGLQKYINFFINSVQVCLSMCDLLVNTKH